MLPIFLQTAINSTIPLNDDITALLGVILALMVFFIIFGLITYIYVAIALMSIAKRTKTKNGWFAFIPFLNLYLLSKTAKMHWWPILLLIVGFLVPSLTGLSENLSILLIGNLISVILIITFFVFLTIWWWKTFKAVGRPGWWILLTFIPFVGILLFFIFIGVAAWGGDSRITQINSTPISRNSTN